MARPNKGKSSREGEIPVMGTYMSLVCCMLGMESRVAGKDTCLPSTNSGGKETNKFFRELEIRSFTEGHGALRTSCTSVDQHLLVG